MARDPSHPTAQPADERTTVHTEHPAGQPYAGRSHDEAVAARKQERQRAQEQAGGHMAVEGTAADPKHSCGELSDAGKRVWQTGSGLDGGGKV
jgi:hypothetical protein